MERLRNRKLPEIQQALRAQSLDGWLFCGYQQQDPLAQKILFLEPGDLPKDRWFYFIPARGLSQKLIHRIEPAALDALPGDARYYGSAAQLQEELRKMLATSRRVAMQYSPDSAMPLISRVDGGTIDLVRRLGKEVVSSNELVQWVEARWTGEQLDQHRRAARLLAQQIDIVFTEVRAAVESDDAMTERRLLQFLSQQLERSGLKSYDNLVVAFGANTAKPRYTPPESGGASIVPGGVLLLELWGRVNEPGAVMAKLAWTGYVGNSVPDEIERTFQAVVRARDAALSCIRENVHAGRRLEGWMPDMEVYRLLQSLGLEQFRLTRTGQSLGQELHGWGADLDSQGMTDTRPLIPRTTFTIEPALYRENYGVKTGLSVYLGETDLEITTQPLQQAVVAILKP
jgi:Xaa-Pro aminopeptidase